VGCDGFVWKYLIPHLEDKYRIVHYNYRGHGKSESPANIENLGIEECVEDLKAVLDDAGVDRPAVLAGHSMGVQVVLEFWHRYPEHVLALIPVTGSYGKAIDHVHDSGLAKQFFPLVKYAATNFSPLVKEFWKRAVHSDFAFLYATKFEINKDLIKKDDFFPYLEHLSRMDPLVFLRTVEGAARHTAEPFLHEITVPTLIVAGEADKFTPYWLSRRMHTMIPDSQLLTLPMGSHTGPIELPELTNLRIEKFLEEVSKKES
jgi:pimeloyl-ACP methyl ester carboxylesterase